MSVDPAAALAMPGVVDFLSHTDVPASKRWGMGQEEVFASEEVSEILPSSDVIGWVLSLMMGSDKRRSSHGKSE